MPTKTETASDYIRRRQKEVAQTATSTQDQPQAAPIAMTSKQTPPRNFISEGFLFGIGFAFPLFVVLMLALFIWSAIEKASARDEAQRIFNSIR